MSDKPVVYVTREIPIAGLDRLEEHCEIHVWDGKLPPSKEHIIERLRELQADGLLCLLSDDVDGEVMDASENLEVVSTFSVGYDHIDIEAAVARDMPVGHTPGVLADTTADFAWSLLMTTARRTVEGHEYLMEGEWETWGPTLLTGPDVHHATLGIVGLGDIGYRVAKRGAGFDMDVVYSDIARHDEKEDTLESMGVDVTYTDLEGVLESSDFISLHTPLLEATHQLISDDEFETMNENAILINTSRGPVVDSEALARALENDEIERAGLDVTDPEPLPLDHSLVEYIPEKLVVTPHIASASIQTRDKMATIAADNLIAGLDGEALPNSAVKDYEAQ